MRVLQGEVVGVACLKWLSEGVSVRRRVAVIVQLCRCWQTDNVENLKPRNLNGSWLAPFDNFCTSLNIFLFFAISRVSQNQ